MPRSRRTFLKSLVGAVLAAGLLPLRALAEWNRTAFEAANLKEALNGIGAAGAAKSQGVVLEVASHAENGALVPITVTSRIPDTQSISILVEGNSNPLAASFSFSNGAEAYVSTQIKMAKTSSVHAVAMAGGKAYIASAEVQVAIGGCD